MGRAAGLVVQQQAMLGAVVDPVESNRAPIEAKRILDGMEAQPVKMHVHLFGLARCDGIVCNTDGGGVIGL